jgi:hydroxymethylpyrimidine pyrophosphatase-like HAD family hydrolase
MRRLASFEARHVCRVSIRFGLAIADGKLVYTDHRFPVHDLFVEDNSERMRLHHDLNALPSLPLSMGVYGPRERVEPLAAAWRETLGDRACVFDQPHRRYRCWTSYFQSGRASKATAARILSEMLGIRREETLAIGDHVNDRELLLWAGLGVCMGDGHEDARACADHITGSLDEDGAAQAIERFILGSQ